MRRHAGGLHLSTDQYAHVKNLGKEPPERITQTIPGAHTGLEIVCVSMNQSENQLVHK